jgi:putative ABC transport system substrate-binding protein
MRRRDFITLLGSAAAYPLGARAQQADRVRRIGVLTVYSQTDREGQARNAAFLETLQRLGWTDGRNVRIEYRWSAGDTDRAKAAAAELVRSTPDVIVVAGPTALPEVQRLTSTIPIVFTQVSDPVDSGFITRLARPGGNTSGFQNFEPTVGGKWLGLLKEAAPATFAGEPDGGLMVLPNPYTVANRGAIILLAARHRLPAVYAFRYIAAEGGLMSYGPDQVEQWRGAATYVDRILRGEKPGDLPIQAPTRYELVINMKAAKVIGLTIPPAFPLRADEVIE